MATVDHQRIEQLEATLSKMELTLTAIAEAVVWTDTEGTIEWANAAFSRLVNAPSIAGANLAQICPLSQAGRRVNLSEYPYQQVCAGQYAPTTYEFWQAEGVRFLEISGQCLEVAADHRIAILVIRDLTVASPMLPQAGQAHEKLVSLLQATLESTADGILVVNRDRNTPIYNQKFLQMWGISESLMQFGQGDERLRFLSEQTTDPQGFITRVWELFRDTPEETTLDLLELKDGRIFERYSQPQWINDEIVGRVWSFRDITVQKRTEQVIQESEARLKLALEAGHMGSWDWNILTNEVKWSDNLEAVHGMPPGSFGGNFAEFLAIIHPQDRDEVSQVINQAVASGSDYEIEFRILWADGSTHWIAGKGKTFHDSTGRAIRMIGLGMDITDRKQTEETLRRNNALLKAQQEAAIDGILVIDEHQKVTFYNQRFWQLWHIPAAVMATSNDRQLLDWVSNQLVQPEAFLARIAYLYNHPEETSQDEIVLKDGRTLDRYSSAVRSPSGECYGRVWYFRDITQQKQAEASLRYNESKFRNLFENSQMGIFRSRVTDGLILEANQRFVELAGYHSVAEIIHQVSTIEFYVDLEKRQEVLKELRRHGKFINFEMQFRRRDGVLRWGLFSLYLDTTQNCLDCVVTDISDRKATEEALRASEAQYRDLVQTANSIILRWDTTGKVCFLNEYGQRFFGFSESEILGQNVVGTIVPATETSGRDLQALMVDIQLHPENYLLNENENSCKNGDRVWIAWANKPILDPQGNLVEILSVGTDATQRKLAEAALAESEAKFRNIVENANDVLFVIDVAGVFSYVSPNLFTVTGFEPAELEGTPFTPLIHPDDLELCLTAVHHVFTTEQSQSGIEYRIQYKDGEYHWQVSNLAPIRDASGQLLIIGVARDITDRKRSEAALQQSERKFRSLFEATSLAVIVADQHHIFDCNRAAEQLFGCSRQELVGKDPAELSPPLQPDGQDSLSLARQHVAIALAQGNHCFEWVHRRADGTDFPVEVWITAVEIGQEKFVQGIIQDLTERKQAEAALAESEAKFRSIVENINDVIFVHDLDMILTYASPNIVNVFGYSLTEIKGKSIAAFVHPEDLQICLTSAQKAADYGERQLGDEVRIRHQDGSWRWISTSISPVTNPHGSISILGVARDITDQKVAEAALRRSELKYRNIFENSQVGICRTRLDNGLFLDANQRCAEMLGYDTAAELIGQHFSTEFYFDLKTRQQMQAELQDKGEVHNFEMKLRRRNGTTSWALFSFRLQAEEGCIDSVIADINDRKHREEALRLIVEGTAAQTGDEFFQSCVRYLAEVLQVRYALVTAYTDATKTRVRSLAFWGGEAIAENFAYSPKGAPCENVLQGRMCFYPEGVQARFPDDPDLVKIGAESYLGIPLIDSAGSILGHLAVLDVKPMEWDPGRELILRIFAARTGAEIERKEADEALERRAQLESLLSHISRHFIDQNADSAINFTLAAIAKFMGAERSCIFAYSENQTRYHLIYEWCAAGIEPLSMEARGGPIETFPQLHQMISRDYVLQVQSLADLPLNSQERNLFASQSIQSLVAVPMTHGGQVIGFICMDVVRFAKVWSQEDINLLKLVGELIAIGRARYQAEEALRIAKEAAESANRAKSVFLANMSHELRTPLNAILGFAQLMERDRALTSRQRESLATINRSGEHLLNLINDVLEMSKIEAGRISLHPTSFDLYHLLHNLQEMFQIRAQARQLSLQFVLAPNLPQYIEADEGKLRQVLINLLGNAVKFTDAGGVLLRVKPVFPYQSGSQPTPTASTSATQLLFEVEDTGRGIRPEDMDKLFQPFFQTASAAQAREGTGLGLAISRQFVQLMGGEIHLKSVVGQGSTFRFEIAIAPGAPPPTEANPAQLQRRVLGLLPGQPQYRILIVDDKLDNQDLLTQLLSSVGFETRTAADGLEAIAQWQQWHPHLIWMDMRMPVLDGYEATRRIRALEANSTTLPTIIIALTASAFEEQRWQILGAGCDDLVRKPFRERLIFDKIAEYLGVQYVYAEPQHDTATRDQNGESSTSSLTAETLRVMPEVWITQLQQAAVEVDAEQITQLIAQIPDTHGELAISLSELVRNFGFDEILDLTQGGTHG